MAFGSKKVLHFRPSRGTPLEITRDKKYRLPFIVPDELGDPHDSCHIVYVLASLGAQIDAHRCFCTEKCSVYRSHPQTTDNVHRTVLYPRKHVDFSASVSLSLEYVDEDLSRDIVHNNY